MVKAEMSVKAAAVSLFLFALTVPSFAQPATEQMDARGVQNLVTQGADLAKPHRVDFFVVVSKEPDAQAVSTEMAGLGYQVVAIQPPSSSTNWTVHAQKTVAPQLDTIRKITRQLDTLASKHGGHYDGWGTTAVR